MRLMNSPNSATLTGWPSIANLSLPRFYVEKLHRLTICPFTLAKGYHVVSSKCLVAFCDTALNDAR